jgi:hypothetical protein
VVKFTLNPEMEQNVDSRTISSGTLIDENQMCYSARKNELPTLFFVSKLQTPLSAKKIG